MDSTKALKSVVDAYRRGVFLRTADMHRDDCGCLRCAIDHAEAFLEGCKESPRRYRIEHDGFVGTKIGEYQRLDGKRGAVLQQDGTKVVHVYGEKWLIPVEDSACPEGSVCATEGCEQPAKIRFERGGVGSYYCRPCYQMIQAIPLKTGSDR